MEHKQKIYYLPQVIYTLIVILVVSIWIGLQWWPYYKSTSNLVSSHERIIQLQNVTIKNCGWMVYQCDDADFRSVCSFADMAPYCYLPRRCIDNSNSSKCHRQMDRYIGNNVNLYYKILQYDFCRDEPCWCTHEPCYCQTEPCWPWHMAAACDELTKFAIHEPCFSLDLMIVYDIGTSYVTLRNETLQCSVYWNNSPNCIDRELQRTISSLRSLWYKVINNTVVQLIYEYPVLEMDVLYWIIIPLIVICFLGWLILLIKFVFSNSVVDCFSKTQLYNIDK